MSKFEDLSAEEKQAARAEFENKDTRYLRRIELLEMVRDGADEARIGRPCPRCKHFPFYAPHDEALIEGHVYSLDGVADVRIHGYCEFCFDLITKEPDEEDDYPRPGDVVGRRAEDGSMVIETFVTDEPSPYHPDNRARVQDLDDGLLPPL